MERDSYRLLLIDDNPTNLNLLQEVIDQNLPACEVVLAGSGPEGLEKAGQQSFDGAFVDMQMPGMDGIEVCRRLKADERTAGIPVVLITAHRSSAELRAEGLDAGAYDFISQPIRNVEMVARIKALFRLRAVEKQLRQDNQGLRKQLVQKTAALRWVAGLLAAGGDQEDTPSQLLELLKDEGELTFQLFKGELFRRFPGNLRRTLLRLSLLETVPVALAESLAEIDQVRGALEYLERQNFFVTYLPQGDCFRFQGPFLDYLRSQARQELGDEEMVALYREAGHWYLTQQQPARALAYLLKARAWSEVEELLKKIAPELYASGELSDLIRDHENALESLSDYPWLVCCRRLVGFLERPARGVESLELSLEGFAAAQDPTGELFVGIHLLRLLVVVDGTPNRLIELLERVEQLSVRVGENCDVHLRLQTQLITALGHLQCTCEWQKVDGLLVTAQQLIRQVDAHHYEVWLRLYRSQEYLFLGKWRSGYRELDSVFRELGGHRVPAITRLSLLSVAAQLLDGLGSKLAGRRLKNLLRDLAGSDLLEHSLFGPLLLLLDASSEISYGHWQHALDLLAMAERLPIAANEHFSSMIGQYRALVLAATGNEPEARRQALSSLEQREGAGGRWFQMLNRLFVGMTLLEAGEAEQAATHLAVAQAQAVDLGDQVVAELAKAFVGLAQPDETGCQPALEALRFLLREAERGDGFLLPIWYPPLMERLLVLGIAGGIDCDRINSFAQRFMGCSFLPDGRRIPLLEFKTLGDFAISMEGRTVLQQQNLPTALRQLLGVMLTAPNSRISQEELQEILWPESTPERSRSKFDSLLLRLRKTFEDVLPELPVKEYFCLQRGIFALNHCRIDALEFERLCREGIRHAKRKELGQAEGCFRQAYELWQGEFNLGVALDDEFRRQDLELIYLEGVLRWSDVLQQISATDEAIRVLQRALQIHSTQDDLVRRLYRLYLGLGKNFQGQQLLRDYALAMEREGYGRREIMETLAGIESGAED